MMTNLGACDYVRLILREEFPAACLWLISHRQLRYELACMVEVCSPLLQGLSEDDRFLKQEIIQTIACYLQDQ
jgi:hypothetical protein